MEDANPHPPKSPPKPVEPSPPRHTCSAQCSRPSPELQTDERGDADSELFHMHVGTLQLNQRWIDQGVSTRLTAAVVFGIAAAGFLAGVLATRAWDGVLAWGWVPRLVWA
ncbi:hypothetical protein IMZ48_30255 [Candidatus Bathyarchaeota archaeon]|nr:hypothetical protein [Candidatus Bathyarchaeota archaeon]